MTKIINIKTGVERTIEPPKLPKCEVCDVDVEERFGGIIGDISKAVMQQPPTVPPKISYNPTGPNKPDMEEEIDDAD